jgi:hypothetical protein
MRPVRSGYGAAKGGGSGGLLAHSLLAAARACSSGWRSRPPPWWTTVDSLARSHDSYIALRACCGLRRRPPLAQCSALGGFVAGHCMRRPLHHPGPLSVPGCSRCYARRGRCCPAAAQPFCLILHPPVVRCCGLDQPPLRYKHCRRWCEGLAFFSKGVREELHCVQTPAPSAVPFPSSLSAATQAHPAWSLSRDSDERPCMPRR